MRRRLLRYFDHGPASSGDRFVDAIHELGSADAGRDHPRVEHTAHECAHTHSTGAHRAACDTSRPPLLQNR